MTLQHHQNGPCTNGIDKIESCTFLFQLESQAFNGLYTCFTAGLDAFWAKLAKIVAEKQYLRYFRSANLLNGIMANLLAFAGSNSSTSINLKLIRYTTSRIPDHTIQVLNMANCPFPMYSEDYEREHGFSNSLIELKDDIQGADGILISVNEHNSNPSAYFKNLIDWLSRLERNFIKEKKVLLLSTSPGKRGGKSALEISENILVRFGADVVATFSLPSFHTNFDAEKGILDQTLHEEWNEAINSLIAKL